MRQGDCFAMSETIQKLPELTEWDVRLMAWHEAGHAVCSFFFFQKQSRFNMFLLNQTMMPLAQCKVVPEER